MKPVNAPLSFARVGLSTVISSSLRAQGTCSIWRERGATYSCPAVWLSPELIGSQREDVLVEGCSHQIDALWKVLRFDGPEQQLIGHHR